VLLALVLVVMTVVVVVVVDVIVIGGLVKEEPFGIFHTPHIV